MDPINEHVYLFVGLDSDKKPTADFIGTGSMFSEINTSVEYKYYAPTKTWFVYSSGGGGGGEPAAYIRDASVSADGKTLTLEKKNGTEVTYTAVGDVTKAYVDTQDKTNLTAAKSYADEKDTTTLTTAKAYTDTEAAKKQDILTAGEGIEITDENVINATASAKLTEELTASYAVGSVSVGQVFAKDTPIEEIIVAMLHNDTPSDSKIYYGMTEEVPTGIEATGFTSETLPADFLTNGATHTYATSGKSLYICVVYPTSAGDLKHIYENGLTFDLISTFNKSVITYNEMSYNLYYYTEAATIVSSDFEFLWN